MLLGPRYKIFFLVDNTIAEVNTLIANVDTTRPGDELLHTVLRLITE
jgi:hypothetical protein